MFRDRDLDLEIRLPALLEYYQASNLIFIAYANAFHQEAVGGRELVELYGHLLRSTVVLLEVVEELRPLLDPDDPSYDVRLAGLEQMKGGLAMITAGTLESLQDHDSLTLEQQHILLGFMEETFPRIVPGLSAAGRMETLRELHRLGSDRAMAHAKPRLDRLSAKLEAAIAVVEP